VPEVLARLDVVPDQLLENLGFGEAALYLSVPDQNLLGLSLWVSPGRHRRRMVGQLDLENAARGWYESDLTDGRPEGGKQLLAEVGGA